jgi:hypothetical protein
MKALLKDRFGYSPLLRRPLFPMASEAVQVLLDDPHLKKLMEVEMSLKGM